MMVERESASCISVKEMVISMKRWTITLMTCALAVAAGVCWVPDQLAQEPEKRTVVASGVYWVPDQLAQEPEKRTEVQPRMVPPELLIGARSMVNEQMMAAR